MLDPLDPHAHLYDVDDESTVRILDLFFFHLIENALRLSKSVLPCSKKLILPLNSLELPGDWWQNSTLPMLAGYEATGIVPVSDSGTINGKGRFQGGPAVPFAVINVVRGKRYRLRFINQSARNVFTMSIDNHPLSKLRAESYAKVAHSTFSSNHRSWWWEHPTTYRWYHRNARRHAILRCCMSLRLLIVVDAHLNETNRSMLINLSLTTGSTHRSSVVTLRATLTVSNSSRIIAWI